MSLRDLCVLYVLVGLACAIAVVRRAPSASPRVLASAAAAVPLWPLWAPFALSSGRGAAAPREGERPHAAVRIERAIAEAIRAVAGTPLQELFSRDAAARIGAEVERVAARLDELASLLARGDFGAGSSALRVQELEVAAAPERLVATARLRHESIQSLIDLRTRDARALEELADLLEALAAQLVIARLAGCSAQGVGAIISEVCARLEGLGVAFEVGPG